MLLDGGGLVYLTRILSGCNLSHEIPASCEPAMLLTLSCAFAQPRSESEPQTQLDWLSEANQVAVVATQHSLPTLGWFSEEKDAWSHAEAAMWGDLRVQFVTSDSPVVLPEDCYKAYRADHPTVSFTLASDLHTRFRIMARKIGILLAVAIFWHERLGALPVPGA